MSKNQELFAQYLMERQMNNATPVRCKVPESLYLKLVEIQSEYKEEHGAHLSLEKCIFHLCAKAVSDSEE